VTSQSPAESDEAPDEYRNAWSSIQYLVRYEGASWSGRESNRAFLNLGNNQFADMSSCTDAAFTGDGRSVADIDWDDDGRADVLLRFRTAPRIRLMRGNGPDTHWVKFYLQGVQSNRDAIGARVVVQTANNKSFTRTIYAGESFLSQSSKTLLFSLGNEDSIEQVVVRWPGGQTESFTGCSIDNRYTLIQGSGKAELVDAQPQLALATAARGVKSDAARPVSRIVLTESIPLGPLGIPSFENAQRKVADLAGSPILLNLWGTTCASCLKEFEGFQERKDKIDKQGLRIVTLCTDPFDKHEQAKKVVSHFGLQRDSGYTDDAFMNALEILLGEIIGRYNGTPLPTSLLLDSMCNLRVVYKGPERLGLILRDVRLLSTINPRDPSGSRLSFGRRLVRRTRDYAGMAELFRGIGSTTMATLYQQLADAAVKSQQPKEEKKESHLISG
jgi:hypothetical protein